MKAKRFSNPISNGANIGWIDRALEHAGCLNKERGEIIHALRYHDQLVDVYEAAKAYCATRGLDTRDEMKAAITALEEAE